MDSDVKTKSPPALTEEEWDIVIEMLERARAALPVEIHHTFRHAFREDLRQRLARIESLLERLNAWKTQ